MTYQYRIRELQTANDLLDLSRYKLPRKSEELECQEEGSRGKKKLRAENPFEHSDRKKVEDAESKFKSKQDDQRLHVFFAGDDHDSNPPSPSNVPIHLIDGGVRNNQIVDAVNDASSIPFQSKVEPCQSAIPDNSACQNATTLTTFDENELDSFFGNDKIRSTITSFESLTVEGCGVPGANGPYNPLGELSTGDQVYWKKGVYLGEEAIFGVIHRGFISSHWTLGVWYRGRVRYLYVSKSIERLKHEIPMGNDWKKGLFGVDPLPIVTGKRKIQS